MVWLEQNNDSDNIFFKMKNNLVNVNQKDMDVIIDLRYATKNNFAKEITSDDVFIKLAKEAEQSPPGSKGVIFLPYFSGERTPIHDTSAKGTFFGLDLTHQRSNM